SISARDANDRGRETSLLLLPFRKQHAALRFVHEGRLHDGNRDDVGRNLAVLHHGVGDFLDETAFLVDRAALAEIDDDFRHSVPPAPDYSKDELSAGAARSRTSARRSLGRGRRLRGKARAPKGPKRANRRRSPGRRGSRSCPTPSP